MRNLIICIAFLWLPSILAADDWPQWMGPHRDNVWREQGILQAFPDGGPKVLWRSKVAGGYSGPAVADGPRFRYRLRHGRRRQGTELRT